MVTFSQFLVKSTFYATIIIGTGYGLMINIVPTEEQLLKTIQENDRKRGDAIQTFKHKESNKKMIQDIIRNSKLDRPIWKTGNE
jgi:hypothetical protein